MSAWRIAGRGLARALPAALLLAACNSLRQPEVDFDGRGMEVSRSRAVAGGTADGVAGLYAKGPGGAGSLAVAADRTIIRTGSLTVAVPAVPAAQAEVERLVGAAGGHVSRTSTTSETVTMTLRIPDGRLDATLDAIAALGEVRQRTLSSQDVTEEVIDLDARIRALETSRDRLRTLHERTNTVEEIIAVERELARVQGELDSLQGRRRSLQSQADLSTVQLTLRRQQVLGPLGVVAAGLGWVVTKLFVWR